MKILIGDKGNVDFDEPIKITNKQKEDFIEFMKTIFAVVEIENIDEIRAERLGDKGFLRKWTVDEYAVLLETKDNLKVMELLGRTGMSVIIQRGVFYPAFYTWCQNNGKNILKGDIKPLITEFLEYTELLKKKRREERKKEKMSKEELAEKIKEIQRHISHLKNMKKILFNSDHEQQNKCEEKIKNLKIEIKNLEERLDKI